MALVHTLATLTVALGQHTPVAYYRFENVSDATIDSRGLCPLVKQSGSSAMPQVQDASTTSVGKFLVFNYGAHMMLLVFNYGAHMMLLVFNYGAHMMPAAPIGGTGRAWRAEACAPHALKPTVPPDERQKGIRSSPAAKPTTFSLPTFEPLAEPSQMNSGVGDGGGGRGAPPGGYGGGGEWHVVPQVAGQASHWPNRFPGHE